MHGPLVKLTSAVPEGGPTPVSFCGLQGTVEPFSGQRPEHSCIRQKHGERRRRHSHDIKARVQRQLQYAEPQEAKAALSFTDSGRPSPSAFHLCPCRGPLC